MTNYETTKMDWCIIAVRAVARIAVSETVQGAKDIAEWTRSRRAVGEPALNDVQINLVPQPEPNNVIYHEFGAEPQDIAA